MSATERAVANHLHDHHGVSSRSRRVSVGATGRQVVSYVAHTRIRWIKQSVSLFTVLGLRVSVFALERAFKKSERWHDLRTPTLRVCTELT